MKATGIIRRVDDLGRVVIPKEIRHKFHITEGDPLEIYVTEEEICLKPYNEKGCYINTLERLIQNMKEDSDIVIQKEIIIMLSEAQKMLEKIEVIL